MTASKQESDTSTPPTIQATPGAIRRMEWLDYARFIAAVGVMMYHFTINGYPDQSSAEVVSFPIIGGVFSYGYLGVDLFFIVSGYVITQSAQRQSAGSFFASRILRLYPAFLFCLCATSIVVIGAGGDINMPQFVANLTMMPMRFGQSFVDGVYWSLTYEIFFYALMFVIICLGIVDRLNALITVWSIAAVACFCLGLRPFFLSGYFSLFAGGCALYLLVASGRWSSALSVLICVGLSMIEAFDRHPTNSSASAAPAAVIVGGFFVAFLVFDYTRLGRITLPASSILGALSYPIYLLHFEVGILALNSLISPDYPLFALFLVVIGVLGAAVGVVMLVEKPTQMFFRPLMARYVATPIDLAVKWCAALLGRQQHG